MMSLDTYEQDLLDAENQINRQKEAIIELTKSLMFCVKKIEKINGECNATFIAKEKIEKYGAIK